MPPRAAPALALPVLALLALPAPAAGAPDGYRPVTLAELEDPPAEDWLMWRRTPDHWGYSPLDQIDRDNVAGLRLAWAWTMEPGMQETTPLVRDGVMFLPQACDFVEAVDAADGSPLWEYRRPPVDHAAALSCANRNAVLYGDRLIVATRDAHLVSLDARTGAVGWERRVGDWTVGQHYSGGPQVLDGKIIAGMSGCYHINTGCWVSAHDPDTGEELWRTATVAMRGEPGGGTWGDAPDAERRGGSVWMPASWDPELDLIYIGVGVPIPWGAVQRGARGGDALYTNSTLALDADTGAIRWHFQHVPGGSWDQDHPFARLVVETPVRPDAGAVSWFNPAAAGAGPRKVVTGVPGKPGIVWTLDAATGEFLWARETNFQNVIAGVDIPGRRGVTNPAIDIAEIGQERLVCPATTGGINWNSIAYSPRTNLLYAPTNDTCMRYRLNPVSPVAGGYHGSASARKAPVPGGDGRVGLLTAVDAATGAARWTYRQRAGMTGSALATGGGLVFVSDDARRLRAFDAGTGEVLWEQVLNASAGGFPVTYQTGGTQYLAIAAGGGVSHRVLTPEIRQRRGGNILYAFALPRSARGPASARDPAGRR